jgi:ribosomal protein L37AE/L43A
VEFHRDSTPECPHCGGRRCDTLRVDGDIRRFQCRRCGENFAVSGRENEMPSMRRERRILGWDEA